MKERRLNRSRHTLRFYHLKDHQSSIDNHQSSIINQIGLANGVMNGRARSFAGSGIAQVVV